MQEGKLNIVFGGQAGSEAKGKLAAFLAYKYRINAFAGCLSPNAGHTVIKDENKIVTHNIPVGVAGGRNMSNVVVVIGPAAIINVRIMEKEIEELGKMGISPSRILIDERARVILQEHIQREQSLTVIGSTAQGVGEARSDKIMRKSMTVGDYVETFGSPIKESVIKDSNALLMGIMDSRVTVLYEMGQGFDLCYDHGVDPIYCTSRNCTPMQGLADMGIPPRYLGDTYAVIRPYPIRVNNRNGNSGPYPSPEITWDAVRRRCGVGYDITEYTTTTKLERRVFEFSESQMYKMIRTCDPTYLCLQFANYVNWECYEKSTIMDLGVDVHRFIVKLEMLTRKKVAYVGTGPGHEAMVDLGVDTPINL